MPMTHLPSDSPPPKSVRLELDARGFGTLHVDDEDLSNFARSVTVTAYAGCPPTVGHGEGDRARVEICTNLAVLVEAGVQLRAQDHAALVALGWTPPGSPGPRVFTPEDVETVAQALWVYWHQGTRWEAEGWSAQLAHEQQAYRDKARTALRALGTVPDDNTFAAATLSDIASVPQDATGDTPPDPTAWRYEPDGSPLPKRGE